MTQLLPVMAGLQQFPGYPTKLLMKLLICNLYAYCTVSCICMDGLGRLLLQVVSSGVGAAGHAARRETPT